LAALRVNAVESRNPDVGVLASTLPITAAYQD
jgi:hypothetical protein